MPPNERPLAGPLPWDLVAEAYAAEVAPMLARFAEHAVSRAVLRPGARVLDVATGPGTLAFVAAAAGAVVDALDFSPEMIARLDERALREEVRGITPRVGDGMNLPYPDATYDAAFSMFGLMFFPDRARALAEIRRVLVSGGRVVIGSWVPLARVPLLAAVFDAIRPHVPLPPNDGSAPLGDLASMRAELGAAGFGEVLAEEVELDVGAATVAEFWPMFARTTAPLVMLRKKAGEQEWSKIEASALDHLRGKFGDAPQSVRMIANIGVGRA